MRLMQRDHQAKEVGNEIAMEQPSSYLALIMWRSIGQILKQGQQTPLQT